MLEEPPQDEIDRKVKKIIEKIVIPFLYCLMLISFTNGCIMIILALHAIITREDALSIILTIFVFTCFLCAIAIAENWETRENREVQENHIV